VPSTAKSQVVTGSEADSVGEDSNAGRSAPTFHITDDEFAQVQSFAFRLAGISISSAKKALVLGRWSRRLSHHRLGSFREYLSLLKSDRSGAEQQIALDLLTTNETYFFREPKHFDFLRSHVLPRVPPHSAFRVWSAAASSGEEAYSVAMLLAAEMPTGSWSVLGTDISSRVLRTARAGLYDLGRTEHIPKDYLQRFCLKGTGPQTGKFMISRSVRERVQFEQANLNEPLRQVGQFDVILLRNVLIYFEPKTKERVIQHLIPALKPGGYFIIGHCDALAGVEHPLKSVVASVYRKA